ncbi:MAG TPA: orotidine-5'-phosphate decarboxylase [Acidimicrobiales bacterium]|nr:orotidine-5'-phosphate decarboxylase [Acidimicrobiales bacterium]
MAETFGLRLQERLREQGPLCVGVDPSSEVLARWGRPDSVEGLEFCCLALLESVSGVAAVIKPQVAFFERFGSDGYRVLERLIREAHDAELLVVADAKRGDVGSTNEGYAQAWLRDGAPLAVDAVTAHAYLGVAALAPLFDDAVASGRGVFVVAATSNPEGRSLQEARTFEQERVQEMILRSVAEMNQRDDGLGSIGVVLGATRDAPAFDLASLRGPYLVPGLGAQGAGVNDVARLFERCEQGTVLVNVARAILFAGPEQRGLRDAARRWRDDLLAAL